MALCSLAAATPAAAPRSASCPGASDAPGRSTLGSTPGSPPSCPGSRRSPGNTRRNNQTTSNCINRCVPACTYVGLDRINNLPKKSIFVCVFVLDYFLPFSFLSKEPVNFYFPFQPLHPERAASSGPGPTPSSHQCLSRETDATPHRESKYP